MSITRLLITAFLLIASAVPLLASGERYRLGPEDAVTLRVVIWNDQTGTYDTMESVAGDYVVSTDGEIAIPIVGRLETTGLTVDELSSIVSERLKASAGLFQAPVVAIQIKSYRPFFILGNVRDPGAFDWRPALTVSKALALAGGIDRARLETASGDNLLRDVSSLRSVQVDLVRLRARSARLESELDGAAAISFPDNLEHPDGVEALQRVIAEETSIFDIRRGSRARNRESNEDLIKLYQTELEGLQGKLEGNTRQMAIAREQVENLRQLVERGTVVANRLVSAERTLTDLSAEDLDLNTAIFRARQRISETRRDLLQADDNMRREATVQLQETRRRLELESKRESMLVGLISESGVSPVGLDITTQITVRRTAEGAVEVLDVDLDTAIQPGDVLNVVQTVSELGQ